MKRPRGSCLLPLACGLVARQLLSGGSPVEAEQERLALLLLLHWLRQSVTAASSEWHSLSCDSTTAPASRDEFPSNVPVLSDEQAARIALRAEVLSRSVEEEMAEWMAEEIRDPHFLFDRDMHTALCGLKANKRQLLVDAAKQLSKLL